MNAIGDPLISFLLERVGDSLIDEVRFLCGVKEEVEEMQIELQWMQSFLEDADHHVHVEAQSQQPHSRVFRLWVSQIKEASLDAEDVVNSYLVKLALRRSGGMFNLIKRFACIVKEGRDIHKVGWEIEAVKSRLANLRTRLQTYGLIRDLRLGGEASSTSSGGQWLRRTYGHIVDPNVVGLDGKMEEVVGLLLKEDEPCRVVSIYGMGGLGKTTLAKKVYHNDKIRRSFDKFVWVCVSQQFKPRDVWETIYIELKSPSPEQRKEISRLKDDEIVSKLYKLQKDHKCFLLLDDIWNIGDWNTLSDAFPAAKEELTTGSKILFTTRNMELSEHVDRRGSYGGLKPLSDEQSWELLQKTAFAGRDGIEDNESMKKLGKEMIEHCGGLPLAIVVLAGTLATKDSLREWEIVHDNIRAYLRRGKGGNDEQLGVDGVLSFSYYDLPHQLKSCFLYLSQFPEDHEIQTSKLLKMWMAEGFISAQNDGDWEELIEDVAERYLKELVGRCMIQVGKKGSSGRIKTCGMHDLMRDLCLSKAKEENFIQIFSRSTETNTVGRVRRLSFFLDEESTMFYYQRNYQLRTLICDNRLYWSETVISARTMANFKLLRMLVLEGIFIWDKKLSKEIGNLIQLKYLSLRNSKVWYFPSMKKLGCLETLDLRVSWGITVWGVVFGCGLNGNAIWKMKNLRHLYLPESYYGECYSKWSKKLESIDMKSSEKVQTLVNFPPPNVEVAQVVKFPNVRKLGIVGSQAQLVEFSELLGQKKVEFSRLSSLSLLKPPDSAGYFPEKIDLEGILMGCPNVYKLRIRGGLVNIPAEVNQLATKLTKLKLEWSEIEDQDVCHIGTYLGKLPNLNILHLQWKSFIGRELCFQPASFPQLKSLRLDYLKNLEEWRVDQGAMPILQSLTIHNCDKLKMVPEGLRFIDTLKELRIVSLLGNLLIERVKEGGADYDKVKHIPSIIIEEGISF